MTQTNKRSYAPPRQASARPAPQRPNRSPAVRPVPAPASTPRRRSAPAPRRPGGFPGGDLIKLVVFGAVVVALAFVLQCFWPNGFPLVVNTDSAVAMQSQVSEIYSSGPLRINEIMTGNRSTLSLEDGSSPDWIEICNIGSGTVNLEGYTLSKTANDGRTFTFPAMTLGSGECVLVYADSRLRQDADAPLHAPFRLSSAGDTLMLFNAGGTAIDTVNIATLAADHSYARMDTYSWQSSDLPTPGLANTPENYQALRQSSGDSPVVLSELMSTNTSTYADENGQYHDYIELYNRSGETVDLSGWYLSDDVQNLRKWRFPACTLGAGETMVVFASGLDRTDDIAHLHTNFGLSSEGEQLVLVSPDGRVMDRVDFDLLKANVALSLTADGSWSSDPAPSPGRAN